MEHSESVDNAVALRLAVYNQAMELLSIENGDGGSERRTTDPTILKMGQMLGLFDEYGNLTEAGYALGLTFDS